MLEYIKIGIPANFRSSSITTLMTLPTESDDDDSKSLSISSISGWNVSSTVLIKCLPRKPENVRSAFGNRFRPVTKKKN